MYIMKGRTKGSIGKFLFVINCTICFKLNGLTAPLNPEFNVK